MTDDGRINDNGGAYAGLTPRGGARADRRRPRRRAATSSRLAPHEMILGRCQRSDDVIEPRLKTQWFINVKPMAEQGDGRGARGPHAVRAAALREGVLRLDGEHPRLERQPPAVVGPPHPGLVLPGRAHHGLRRARTARTRCATSAAGRPPSCARTRTSSTPGSRAASGRSRRSAGRTTRPTCGRYYPTTRDGDRLRHHLLLGRPDDDARRVADRPRAVRVRSTCTAWCATRRAPRCPRRRATSSTR